jgi:hypothetical protein
MQKAVNRRMWSEVGLRQKHETLPEKQVRQKRAADLA